MTALAIKILLAFVNLAAGLLKMKCLECGKRLKLKLVSSGTEKSIECSCCWRLSASRGHG